MLHMAELGQSGPDKAEGGKHIVGTRVAAQRGLCISPGLEGGTEPAGRTGLQMAQDQIFPKINSDTWCSMSPVTCPAAPCHRPSWFYRSEGCLGKLQDCRKSGS
jgi:hypothetical protein